MTGFNRRPANPTERQFGWADQPQGAQLCDGYLKPGEALRGSGQDLFMLLLHADGATGP